MESNKKNDLKTVSGFSSTIIQYKGSIGKFLNPRYGITAEDFIETCIRAVKENPKLLQCDPKSLFGAVLLSAEIGLKPNTALQHSFIIPYKGQAKFQIGYKGLIEIMYRNPRVKQITARAVFEKDDFDYGYGLTPYLNHKPARKEKGKLECVYATCLVDNEPIFVVVEKAELDAIRGFSQTIQSAFSPYNNGTDIHNWMEIKAGVKALSKLIPTSNNIEMAKAVEYDSKFEGGARVMVEIPSNPNEIVEPQLLDGNIIGNTIETAFDIIEENQEQEQQVEIKEEPATFHAQSPTVEKTIESSFKSPIEFDKPKESFVTTPIETINRNLHAEPVIETVKTRDLDWELPIKEYSVNDEEEEIEIPSEKTVENNGDEEEEDNSFPFPDNDEEDENDIQTSMF
jgi:recombination protein RecT